ncbi:8411_t:CDS:10 [Ambispora leptoticha]|uniref:8411_t:CDS:1 n=1 Tax=Ambispora leptoticha TaxID=144679 RepID=A0A9N8YK65_9GLOM|nr:8411_t:CDS:10 [Ambispora leptoticha]
MNKQELNKNYYQTHKEVIKARQKERYQLKKTTPTPKRKSLGTYYHAHNIKVLISLKDYLERTFKKSQREVNGYVGYQYSFKAVNAPLLLREAINQNQQVQNLISLLPIIGGLAFENNSEMSGFVGKIMPYIPLILEDITGQKMRMGGTIGDILACLQRLEQKFDGFAKNTAEQFILQEKQISTLLNQTQSLTDFRSSLEGSFLLLSATGYALYKFGIINKIASFLKPEVDPITKEEKYTLRIGGQRFVRAGFFKEENNSIASEKTIPVSETIPAVNETTNSVESQATTQQGFQQPITKVCRECKLNNNELTKQRQQAVTNLMSAYEQMGHVMVFGINLPDWKSSLQEALTNYVKTPLEQSTASFTKLAENKAQEFKAIGPQTHSEKVYLDQTKEEIGLKDFLQLRSRVKELPSTEQKGYEKQLKVKELTITNLEEKLEKVRELIVENKLEKLKAMMKKGEI